MARVGNVMQLLLEVGVSRDDTLAMRCMFFYCCVKYISHLSVYIYSSFFWQYIYDVRVV